MAHSDAIGCVGAGLKRKLYDKFRHNCFRLAQRPRKDWVPEKQIHPNDEKDTDCPDRYTNSSLSERTNSKPDMFYTVDGRWLPGDWTALGVSTTPKKRNSTTILRQRRLYLNSSMITMDSMEVQDGLNAKGGECRLVQTILPWFFPWVIALLTNILLLPTPPLIKRQHQQQKPMENDKVTQQNSPTQKTVNKATSRRISLKTTPRDFASISPPLFSAISTPSSATTQTKPTTATTTTSSTSSSSVLCRKKSSSKKRDGGNGSSIMKEGGRVSIVRCSSPLSPRTRLAPSSISPRQRLIMSSSSSPRNSAKASIFTSRPNVICSFSQSSIAPIAEITPDEDRHSSTSMAPDTNAPNANTIANKPEVVEAAEEGTLMTHRLQTTGLLSRQFAINAVSSDDPECEKASTSTDVDICQEDEDIVESARLARSCSGSMVGAMASSYPSSVLNSASTSIPSRVLQRSAKSLPKETAKTKALSILRAKKAEKRQSFKSIESLEVATSGNVGSIPSEGMSTPIKSESSGLSSSSTGATTITDLSISIPRSDQIKRIGLNGDEDMMHDEDTTPNRIRSVESQNSIASISSIGLDLERVTSMQTAEIIRSNMKNIHRTTTGSTESTLIRWSSSMSEQDLIEYEDNCGSIDTGRITEEEEQPTDSDEASVKKASVASTQVKKLNVARQVLMTAKTSPFAHESYQRMSLPKTDRSLTQKDGKMDVQEAPQEKKSQGRQMNEKANRIRVQKPPPPPPKSNMMSKEKKEEKVKPTVTRGTTQAPPPPPSSRKNRDKNGCGISRDPSMIAMFHEVSKPSKGKAKKHRKHSSKSKSSDATAMTSIGSGGGSDNLIKEFEKNSRHFMQIQRDVEKYGPKIEEVIADMAKTRFKTMQDLNVYVREVDVILEKLEDEPAVLKHFNWPTKYYVYREALALWTEMQARGEKCRNWVQGTRDMSAELTKMKKHMELLMKRMDTVQRSLENEVKKFTANGVPWDTTIIPRLQEGTVILLEKYMQIVYNEVSLTQTKTTQTAQNAQFLKDTIKLAFKVHQFVGGVTESCSSLFQKIANFTRTLNKELEGNL